MLYYKNNKVETIRLNIIESILTGREPGDLSKICKLYKLIKEDVNHFSEKNKGKYLALKVFFEAGSIEIGTLSGNEMVGKVCEREMLKMLKLLYNYQLVNKQYVFYEKTSSDCDLNENSELAYIKTMLETDNECSLEKKVIDLKEDYILSSELNFVLTMFDSIHSMMQTRIYNNALDECEQIVFPYYYLDDEYVSKYYKLSNEYKEILRRLYEYRLKEDLGIQNIHVDLFVNEKNRLMCIVTKKRENQKNKCLQMK